MDQVLDRLIDVVAEADDLEAQVRPLLELLQSVTGLESTYLTAVDLDRDEQSILFARNAAPERIEIPEGAHVPWDDTLCERALEEGRPFCDDVPGHWGDSDAARELGIVTYLSEPVRIGDGELYGTLCAASGDRVAVPEHARRLLRMFAVLVARQVERDELLTRLRAERHEFATAAMTDGLTGLPNRRALTEALNRALANAARGGTSVVVAFADLDGFKQVNDRFGHGVGDRFLVQIARRWRDGLRDGDLITRIGGDEFVVLAFATGSDPDDDAEALRTRVAKLATGVFDLGDAHLAYDGPSVGAVVSTGIDEDAVAVLRRADRAMYAAKLGRRPKA
ncbi:MAG: GGDEF domain-containing protein [Trueperaceae bacterium]